MNGATYDLRNIWYAKYACSNGIVTYSGGRRLGEAMKANITPNYIESPLHSEGRQSENKRRFKNGNIALGVKGIDNTTKNDLFGHVTTTETINGNTVFGTRGKKGDSANFVGIACYTVETDNDVDSYYCQLYRKVKFGDPPANYQTVGENIQWVTPELAGVFMADDTEDGAWYEDAICTNEADAIEWVKSKLGIASCATPTASPAAGAVASGTEIALTSTTAGASIYYTTDGSTPTASSTLYSSGSKPAVSAATTIKAIAIKTGLENSSILTAAYTMT